MGSRALTLSLFLASLLNVHASNTTDDAVSKGDDNGGITTHFRQGPPRPPGSGETRSGPAEPPRTLDGHSRNKRCDICGGGPHHDHDNPSPGFPEPPAWPGPHGPPGWPDPEMACLTGPKLQAGQDGLGRTDRQVGPDHLVRPHGLGRMDRPAGPQFQAGPGRLWACRRFTASPEFQACLESRDNTEYREFRDSTACPDSLEAFLAVYLDSLVNPVNQGNLGHLELPGTKAHRRRRLRHRRHRHRRAHHLRVRRLRILWLRMWHPGLLDHFYTTVEAEKNKATSQLGYKLEDLPGYVYPPPAEGQTECPRPETKPLYRMYKYPNADHFYTMNAGEKQKAISSLGYNDEGIAACIPPA